MKILEADRRILYKILNFVFSSQNLQPTTMEVGVLRGENALDMYDILQPKKMYLVDAWDTRQFDDFINNNLHRDWVKDINSHEHYFGGKITEQKTMDKLYSETQNKFSLIQNVEIIRKNSTDGLQALKDVGCQNVNHIYIDASHQFETVLDDLIQYETILDKEIGCIQMNDCCFSAEGNKQNLGVLEAVLRFCKMKEFMPITLVNRNFTDLIIARKGSTITDLIDETIQNSDIPFIEVPNELLGSLSILGKQRANISFCNSNNRSSSLNDFLVVNKKKKVKLMKKLLTF